MRGHRIFEVLPAANTSAAQEMSRRYQVRAGLVAAIARGDADQTRRLITEHSLLTASDTDR
jgi:hypothetical protein